MYFVSRELRAVMSALAWGGIGGFQYKKSKLGFQSKEAHAISMALSQASEHIAKFESDLERTRGQLFPSLLNEMNSNIEPPYEFDAILARIDINNATAVYTNPSLKYIQSHWFDYFKVKSAEIATRYGGYAHEEMGDEIILYFKLQENENSYALAVSAIRDILRMTEDIHESTMTQFQFPFKIKGVLDFGRLRVFKSSLSGGEVRRLNIEGLSGTRADGTEYKNMFLSTVRIMKMITEKKESSIIISDEILIHSGLVVSQSSSVLGLPMAYQQFGSYSWIRGFSPVQFSNESQICYFRSDSDLIQYLHFFDTINNLETKKLWLKSIRDLKIPSPSLELQQAWHSSLSKILDSSLPGYDVRALASFIMTGELFVKDVSFNAQFETELEKTLLKCLLHEDARVQANTIEIWGKLNMQSALISGSLKKFNHNRSFANALVVILKNELTPKPLKILKHMIKQREPLMMASACYALAEVIQFYMQNNAFVIHTNPELQDLIKMSMKLCSHENEIVARQAQKVSAVLNAKIQNAA